MPSPSEPESPDGHEKDSSHGTVRMILVPSPTDDPADPLNWSASKKALTLSIVSLAACIGVAQALANQSGFFVQARLYDKTPVQISYSVSSGIVGLAVGPLVWAPLAQRIGRSSCIFWGILGTLICCVWSAVMTGRDDYTNFTVSRFFAGFFGSVASAIGAGTIIDIYFLHQRGKAFMFYTAMLLFGTVLAPTVSGYIVSDVAWPVQLWWTVGVEGFVAVLIIAFLEETGFPRQEKQVPRRPPQTWFQNRTATFLPGHKILTQSDRPPMHPLACFIIGVCPLSLLAGLLLMVDFGWLVATNTLLSVFLQTPQDAGGYGFTAAQTASFTFSQWVGVLSALMYGVLVNDRLPIAISERRGHSWKPEYRLYPLLLPSVFLLPVGLGLFGASLQYHLHYMVLALATFLIVFSVNTLTPVMINYVVESFTGYAAEATTIMTFYRLILGLLVPFFVEEWEERITVGWTFGMMACFSFICSFIPLLFIWQGQTIRKWSFSRFQNSEDGAIVGKKT